VKMEIFHSEEIHDKMKEDMEIEKSMLSFTEDVKIKLEKYREILINSEKINNQIESSVSAKGVDKKQTTNIKHEESIIDA